MFLLIKPNNSGFILRSFTFILTLYVKPKLRDYCNRPTSRTIFERTGSCVWLLNVILWQSRLNFPSFLNCTCEIFQEVYIKATIILWKILHKSAKQFNGVCMYMFSFPTHTGFAWQLQPKPSPFLRGGLCWAVAGMFKRRIKYFL